MQSIGIMDMRVIKRRAEAAGYSLKIVAERAGITPSAAYRALPPRKTNPRGRTWRRLNDALRALELAAREERARRREKIARDERRKRTRVAS